MHKGSDKCNPFSFRNVRKVSPVTHLKNCGAERPGLETFCLCLPLGNPGRPRAPQNDGRKILVLPGFPTRSRGIGRVSTKVASHGRRSAEIGSPETVREQRIALLCYDSFPAGGQAAVVAHPKQLCRFRIPTHGIAADRRIVVRHEEIEGSPASFRARAISSAVLRASSVTVARSSDGISIHPYGAMGSVRPSEKTKTPDAEAPGVLEWGVWRCSTFTGNTTDYHRR